MSRAPVALWPVALWPAALWPVALWCGLLSASLAPQSPESRPPGSDVLFEVRGPSGVLRITESAYREHLRVTIGEARLEELCVDRLLEQAVLQVPAEEWSPRLRAALAEPERVAQEGLDRRITELFDGDRSGWRRYLEQSGRTLADELALCRLEALRSARIELLVRRERVVGEPLLIRMFEERYGPDGVSLRIRHALFGFADAERRLRAGRPTGEIPRERIEALARSAADGARRRLAPDGGDFSSVSPESIEDYRFQRLGVDIAAALRAAETGRLLGPLRSAAGMHLLVVDERRVVEFDAVRADLERIARRRPPSLAEWQRLRQQLLVRSGAAAALAERRRD